MMARKMRDIGVAAGKVFHAEAQRGRGAERMKPSGIPWIGDIPEGWKVIPARHVFVEVTAKNKNGKYTRQLSFRYGEIVDKGPNQSHNAFPEETILTYTVVEPNTIMINGLNLNYDLLSFRVAIVKEVGIITSAYLAVLPQSSRIIPWYALYLLKAYDFKMVFHGQGSGIRMTLKFADFATLPITLPPLPEQRAIADYLDEKCGAIDATIAEAKKGIEEYKAWKKSFIFEAVTGKRRVGIFNAEKQSCREAEKMKPSGIPWIGEIPEGWKLARLKNCAKVFGRIGFRGYTTADIVNEGEGALSLSPSNLKDIRMDYTKRTYISWSKYEESPEIKVCKGDIVFVKTGSSYGKACIVDDMPCEATLNPQLVVLKCFSCHNRYLNYYLQTPLIKYQVELIVSGGTIPTMSQEKMGGWKIILPPLPEQQAIADYLDGKCAAIDAMVAEKEILIADLEAYKKSLIYETVTGKRRMP